MRERGFRVRAFVRTLDDRATRLRELNAEVVQGDLLDIDAVSSAMVGVTAAYFCYPIDPPRLLEATAIFAQAATEAGRGHRRHAPDDGRAVHHHHPDCV